MHNDTAYGLLGDGMVRTHKRIDGQRVEEVSRLAVIPMTAGGASHRHGVLPDGSYRPYKGYKGDSNYCIEVFKTEGGNWASEVISTFQAYQVVKVQGIQGLRNLRQSLSGKPLVMRLMRNDIVRLEHQGVPRTLRIATISGNGQIFMAEHNEANTDARNRSKELPYISKKASSLKTAKARRVSISPTGVVCDPGFMG
jgi:CRISPR-associated endonuclease Csn1